MSESSKDLMWLQTLFCQINNDALYKDILEYAISLDCQIAKGENNSADLIAIPSFVLIIDRNEVGREMWSDYLEFSNDVKDKIPCVVIDDNAKFNSPKYSNIYYLSYYKERKLEIIKRIIDYARSRAVLESLLDSFKDFDELINSIIKRENK